MERILLNGALHTVTRRTPKYLFLENGLKIDRKEKRIVNRGDSSSYEIEFPLTEERQLFLQMLEEKEKSRMATVLKIHDELLDIYDQTHGNNFSFYMKLRKLSLEDALKLKSILQELKLID